MDEASRRSVLLVAALGYALLAGLPAAAALTLIPVAETLRGKIYGVAALCLLALPVLAGRALLRRRRARALLAGASALLGVLLAVLYAASPDGRPLAGSPLRSEFLAEARYRRFSIAALLPEIDQVALATYVAPFIDPIIDRAQGARIRAMTMPHYRAMEADPEMAALGTVLPYAYADTDAAHLFAYAPPHAAGEHLPAILFLHGSAGNFKSYFYLWRGFADRTRMAVVCPSFGWGNWYEPGGVEAVERARRWAISTLGADEQRIFLVGLSNGGTGVTRAAAANPGAYRGLVLISAVLEDEILRGVAGGDEGAALPWPMLVLHGKADDRIPFADVQRSIARLRKKGAMTEDWFVDGEDHFLFFHRSDELLGRVADWVNRVEAGAAGAAPPVP
jgi:predicted esterase